jgi:hypothetical protein
MLIALKSCSECYKALQEIDLPNHQSSAPNNQILPEMQKKRPDKFASISYKMIERMKKWIHMLVTQRIKPLCEKNKVK